MKRTKKPPAPFSKPPGETTAARYLRLYAKARAEHVYSERDNQTGALTVYNPSGEQTQYIILQWEWGNECTCPQGGAHNVCKHLTVLYPPSVYKPLPCPHCSGTLYYWHDPASAAVRCIHCGYCEDMTGVALEHPALSNSRAQEAERAAMDLYGRVA
jgi:Zn ribbon nucleic-acid-binding protein